jgi:hypothetical protein
MARWAVLVIAYPRFDYGNAVDATAAVASIAVGHLISIQQNTAINPPPKVLVGHL